ncbi:retron system putative HNH endonuclease [Armatimonas sp.]|uniref:retron system putative HNH endonuclease n=1 Tax=Armatimonas sp. TaxID=1872638 RepID=UPI00375065A3
MIAVIRKPIPITLQDNQSTWTESLCRARKAFFDAEAAWEAGGRVGAKPRKPIEADAKNAWYGQDGIRRVLEEEMFHHKCAYCEGSVRGHSHLHIEHFRPQSVYPAFAYEWHNLLLACGICNCKPYKEDRFPVGASAALAEPNRANPCEWNRAEMVVLVNPCVDDPAEFFVWKFEAISSGEEVTATLLSKRGNLRGSQTITICGLDRVNLTENYRRQIGLVDTALSLHKMAVAFSQEENQIEALKSLKEFISPRGTYSSMVRAYLEYRNFDLGQLTQSLQS